MFSHPFLTDLLFFCSGISSKFKAKWRWYESNSSRTLIFNISPSSSAEERKKIPTRKRALYVSVTFSSVNDYKYLSIELQSKFQLWLHLFLNWRMRSNLRWMVRDHRQRLPSVTRWFFFSLFHCHDEIGLSRLSI